MSLDFSFFPLKFPPFLGINHLENVSMRYRYPKVLGYRVLGVDIDPALASEKDSLNHESCSCRNKHKRESETGCRLREITLNGFRPV